jgi:hypothetical protein
LRTPTFCTRVIFAAYFCNATTSEHHAARRLLRALSPDMLVLWDRGFHSYELVAAVRQRGAHDLGRLPAQAHPQVLRRLPDGSQLVALRPPRTRPGQPALVVRLITYTLADAAGPRAGKPYRLITTLLDAGLYPARDLAGCYHERWEIEGVFDEQDTHQRLAARTLRRQQPVGVLQELYGWLIAHYAVRVLMHEAALRAWVDPDRLSFTQAVRVLGEAVLDFQVVVPAQWPRLYTRLLDDLARHRLPQRRRRSNPRAGRRRTSKFPQKRPGQRGTTSRQTSYHDLIVLLPLSAPSTTEVSATGRLERGEVPLI